ncbi:alcohol dehydrogenase [Pendulispora rubella]|uniref:Alcohol dehydrogenase n=1 Tax=Pendulispora rubella TaxID=2741070 RepID=A0ABZ2KT84_9BACT
MQTYRAVQVRQAGTLEIVQRPIPEPGPGEVRVRVEACGVCHTDALTIENKSRGLTYPRVPGHEIAGRIDALGPGVSGWQVGQRVGVGFLGGHCGHCGACRRGHFVDCTNQRISGITHDGGYAEMVVAHVQGLVALPDGLDAREAAPLLCAGVTTYNALRNSPARGGDLVAIQGIGGLGHLAIQYAKHMGFRVAAIARGAEKAALATRLGATHYIDSVEKDPTKALQELGGARVILATAADSKSMGPLVGGLTARGRMIIVGGSGEPVPVLASQLIFGGRSVEGALTGSAVDAEDTLAFSVHANVRAMIETVPLEKAAEAYAHMMNNKARFRMVMTMT